MTNEEKIKFVDALLEKFATHINDVADKDREPMEFDDEDENGNIVRRYFPTSFQYRKECAVEEIAQASEDLLPFAYDLFDYLGYMACGISPRNDNIFAEK